MKKMLWAIAPVTTLVLAATAAWAATSSPASGDWKGHFKGVSPATSVSFSVAKGANGKRTVSSFQSSGAFKEPCADAHGASTAVGAIPSATVNAAGKFKAVGKEDTGFGEETWTVSGTFKSKHAASGTVAINLAITSTQRCKFTVAWTASLEPLAHPARGATYTGKTAVSTKPVELHVSASGKKLSSVSWQAPIIGGQCPGIGSESPTFTAHNVPIHKSAFKVKIVRHKGANTTSTETISGQFLSGRNAAGTVSTVSDIKGFGKTCKGNETWTAHAK